MLLVLLFRANQSKSVKVQKMEKANKILFRKGRIRLVWLGVYPKRGEDRIYIETGLHPEFVPGFINTGAFYIGIGKLVFLWLVGIRKPKNVIRFRQNDRRK